MTGAAPTLRGRGAELRRLTAALDGETRAVVLSGPPGAGKSSVAAALAEARRAAGDMVAFGRHAEGEPGVRRALAAALGELLRQGLDQLHDPQAGLAALRSALGPSAATLDALNPGWLGVAAGRTGAPLTAAAASERLALATLELLRWLGGFGQPLLLVLDDWGRAGEEGAALYGRLVEGAAAVNLRVVATERSAQPLTPRLNGALWVELDALSADALHAIAVDRLDGDMVAASAVLELLAGRSPTPLDVHQTLSLLTEAGALTRPGDGAWRLDRGAAAALMGEDAAAALVAQTGRGPAGGAALLDALALVDEADEAELALVAGWPADGMAPLVRDGLIRRGGGRARMAHDRVRAAVLAAMTDGRRRALALAWSERLGGRERLAGVDLTTALRLRLAAGMEGADPAAWAERFIDGAAAQRGAGDHVGARAFADAAMALERRAGRASYRAAHEAVLAALLAGDAAAGAEHAVQMAERARGPAERAEAAEAQVIAARLGGDPAAAFDIGLRALDGMGFRIAQKPTPMHLLGALARLRLTPDTPVPDNTPPAVNRLLNTLGGLGFERNPQIAVVMAARSAAHPSLRGTPLAAGLRTVLACLTGDWRTAARWGEIAFERLEAEPDAPLRAPARQLALQFGRGLSLRNRDLPEEVDRLQRTALEEGDLGVAAYANRDRATAVIRQPVDLHTQLQTLDRCAELAERFHDRATAPMIAAVRQIALNLMEGGPQMWRLAGPAFDLAAFEREAGPELGTVVKAASSFEGVLANACGAWESSVQGWRRLESLIRAQRHHPNSSTWLFNTGLARARCGVARPAWERRLLARSVRFNPDDLGHRLAALNAEDLLAAGRTREGLALYESAVRGAERSGLQFEHGTVARAARDAARGAGAHETAERFHAEGQAAWRRLGALALVEADAGWSPKPFAQGAEPASAAPVAETAARSRLLAEVAHELRTPLQAIQGLLDLAADRPEALELDRLQEAFAGLRGVVADLTDFSALDGDAAAIVPAPYDPVRVVETEAALARANAQVRGRAVRVVAPAADGLRMGDGGRLAQIVRNLLSNAIKYGDGEITATLMLDRASLTLTVADKGPGLSAADLTRLFQPFTRGSAAERAEGLGLGLALCRRLAEQMGGSLDGTNGERGGALFTLSLPAPVVQATPEQAESGALRILLAEDVAMTREALARLLQRRGHTVTEAADGEAAVQAARLRAFDVLVLDRRMPGLGGAEALAQLRDGGVATPAIILSALVDRALADAVAELGPVTLLQKPVTGAELAEAVARAAGAEGAARAQSLDALLGEDAPVVRAEAAAELERRIARILADADAGDWTRVEETAHAAAGLAGQFGDGTAAAALLALEHVVRSGENPRPALDAVARCTRVPA